MNASKLYMIIGVALVAIIVIVLLLPDENEAPQQQPPAAGEMPPGHPDVPNMGGDENPGAGNVRGDFMAEFKRLGDKIEAQDASDTSDVLVYARMLLDAHQAKNALPLFERYIKAAPKNTAAMLDLSVAYFETKQEDKAENITRRVLKLEPENTTAMYNLGALAAVADNKEEARAIWEELIAKYPDSQDAMRAKEMMKQL
ncbi:tetratricopeptide repeat protein [bacterium]|nr:tetratricopeptide repeat protein [bacterium]